jgi:hypothetical protein
MDGGSDSTPSGSDFSQFGSQYQPSNGRKLGKWLIPVAISIVVLAAALVFFAFQGNKKEGSKDTSSNDPKAVAGFYDSLAKGASQQNIRVAQYRTTYATKADLEAKSDPGYVQSSIGELVNNKYRGVYAQKPYDKTEFDMERCIDGVAYWDGLVSAGGSGRPAPKNLTEANEYLKQMYRLTEAGAFAVCSSIGLRPGGVVDLAPSRMSDGFMPVTFSESQASNWKNKLQAADLFTIKDEGITEHNAKKLRKYSFEPRGDASTINKQLYDIFYETGEIEKIMRDHPKAEWKYEFISINAINNGGIKGYYLVDEQTGLPVYSELIGVGEDKQKAPDQPVRKANLGFNKQTYQYPTGPTIELTTPLEILE